MKLLVHETFPLYSMLYQGGERCTAIGYVSRILSKCDALGNDRKTLMAVMITHFNENFPMKVLKCVDYEVLRAVIAMWRECEKMGSLGYILQNVLSLFFPSVCLQFVWFCFISLHSNCALCDGFWGNPI